MFTVYVLRCKDGSFYIGQTADLDKRLKLHAKGHVKWTASRLPVDLVHSESFETREDAVKREKALKSGYGRKWIKKHFK